MGEKASERAHRMTWLREEVMEEEAWRAREGNSGFPRVDMDWGKWARWLLLGFHLAVLGVMRWLVQPEAIISHSNTSTDIPYINVCVCVCVCVYVSLWVRRSPSRPSVKKVQETHMAIQYTCVPKSISSGVKYVTLQKKNFSHPKVRKLNKQPWAFN